MTDAFLRGSPARAASTPRRRSAYADSRVAAGRARTAPTPTPRLGIDATPTFTVSAQRRRARANVLDRPSRARQGGAMSAALDTRARAMRPARRLRGRRARSASASPTYLTIVHYTGGAPVCAIAHGCETVQQSRLRDARRACRSRCSACSATSRSSRSLLRDDETARTATAFLALAGFGFSAWLTYVEVGRLHAICIWCVGSAICMTVLAALSVARVMSSR